MSDLSKFGQVLGNLFTNDRRWGQTVSGETAANLSKVLGRLVANIDPGGVSHATLTLDAADPSNTNTCTIDGSSMGLGTDVYEFLTAGGTVANDDNIGVVRGVSKGSTRTGLIAAINGAVSGATGLFKGDGSPARTNGTLPWYAYAVNTTDILIRSADKVGGTVVSRADTTEVSETFTDGSDIWDVGTGNPVNIGRAPLQIQTMIESVEITTALITFGQARISFANEIGVVSLGSPLIISVEDSSGVPKTGISDTFAIDPDTPSDLVITLGGGGGDLADGDVVTVSTVGAIILT